MVQVAVHWRDMSRASLLCLARTLRAREPVDRDLYIAVFDDVDAARYFLQPDVPPGTPVPEPRLPRHRWREQFTHVRAVYDYKTAAVRPDKEPGGAPHLGEHFWWLPMGHEAEQLGDRMSDSLDFTRGPQPPCRNELHGRCLVKMDAFHYPDEWLNTRSAQRSFSVVARIRRDGQVTAARLAGPPPADRAGRGMARAVVQHLHSWRLEPAATEDAIELTVTVESQAPADDADRGVAVTLDLPRISVLVHSVGRPD